MGTLRCFRRIPAAKSFYGCEGDISFFRQILVVSQYRKNSWEPFNVSESSWCRKSFMDERGNYYFFQSFVFVSHYRKLSFGTLRCFRKLLVAKKIWLIGGMSRFWFEFLCATVPENSIGDSSFFQKTSGGESFLWMRLEMSRFPLDFLFLTLPKNFIGNTSLF